MLILRSTNGPHRRIHQRAKRVRQQILPKPVPAFLTDDGEVFDILDLPEDLGHACALASESTPKKFWDTPEEDAAWRDL